MSSWQAAAEVDRHLSLAPFIDPNHFWVSRSDSDVESKVILSTSLCMSAIQHNLGGRASRFPEMAIPPPLMNPQRGNTRCHPRTQLLTRSAPMMLYYGAASCENSMPDINTRQTLTNPSPLVMLFS